MSNTNITTPEVVEAEAKKVDPDDLIFVASSLTSRKVKLEELDKGLGAILQFAKAKQWDVSYAIYLVRKLAELQGRMPVQQNAPTSE